MAPRKTSHRVTQPIAGRALTRVYRDILTGMAACTQGVCSAQPVKQSLPYASVLVSAGDAVYFGANIPGGAGTVGSATPSAYAPATLSQQPNGILSLAVDVEGKYVYAVAVEFDNSQGHFVRFPASPTCSRWTNETFTGSNSVSLRTRVRQAVSTRLRPRFLAE